MAQIRLWAEGATSGQTIRLGRRFFVRLGKFSLIVLRVNQEGMHASIKMTRDHAAS
jgi:hypothetical protein